MFGRKKETEYKTPVNVVFESGSKEWFPIEHIPKIGETIHIPKQSNYNKQTRFGGMFLITNVIYQINDEHSLVKNNGHRYNPNCIFIYVKFLNDGEL
jgi:hypothetical protein